MTLPSFHIFTSSFIFTNDFCLSSITSIKLINFVNYSLASLTFSNPVKLSKHILNVFF